MCYLLNKWKRHETERKKSDTSNALTCTLTWQWDYTGCTQKYTGPWSSVIAYWWARLGRVTPVKPETPGRTRAGRAAAAGSMWFGISTLSLNKTGLAGGRERREQKRKEKRDRQWASLILFFILFTRERGWKTERCVEKWRWENIEGGCTSTRNLIMHGRAAGENEGKRDGWRGKKAHLHRVMEAGGEEGEQGGGRGPLCCAWGWL